MFRSALFALVGFALCVPFAAARAEEASGCAAFKWPIADDQAALAASADEIADGQTAPYGKGVSIRLTPANSVHYAQQPERAPRPETFGAVIALPAPAAAGVYRITLSDAAWIDLIEEGAVQKPLAFSGARDCAHVRKTLKFRLSGKPVALQISGAPAPALSLIASPE